MARTLLTLLYPGFAEWEITLPLFCLYPAVVPTYATLGPSRVRGAMGFEMDIPLAVKDVDPSGYDGVFLPGGIDPETRKFPRRLAERADLLALLRAFAEAEKVVAAICGAPLVLGAAGLLDGKRFACDVTEDTHGWLDRGRRSEDPLVVEERILTASVRAVLPFGAALARLLGEEETAQEIESFLLPARPGC
jgi:4-methyl-5(b-hydroxyethyl)-thiazole monophosphate biosynthesis